jgi:hypothetical protein
MIQNRLSWNNQTHPVVTDSRRKDKGKSTISRQREKGLRVIFPVQGSLRRLSLKN